MVILASFLSCASGHQDVFPIDTPQIRSIQTLNGRLNKIALSSPHISLKSIGQVTYENFTAPVQMITVLPKEKPVYHVLVVGGIHGNEPAGVEAVMDLIETVSKHPYTYKDISFDFIPCINPWGWSHDIRFNMNGRDINRDFASFKSQEATIIRDIVKNTTYDLILDHHEDPNGKGFYLYQYDTPDQTLSRTVIENVKEAGYPIEKDVNMILLKTDNGLIDAPRWGLWYMKLTRQLSMTNYFRLYNSEHVYTIETPTRMKPEERLEMHRIAQRVIINDFLKTRENP